MYGTLNRCFLVLMSAHQGLHFLPMKIFVTSECCSSIILLQAMSFTSRGVSTAYVTGESGNAEMKRGVAMGLYSLVFFTPELLISNSRWRKVIASDLYSKRLKGFAIDEAHCVKMW